MSKIKKKIGNKGLGVTLVLMMLFVNSFSVMAMVAQQDSPTYVYEENAEEFLAASCWNCGNYNFYQTIESDPWVVNEIRECTHGRQHDIIEASDVYSYVRCSYCHYVHEKKYLRTDWKSSCR